MGNELVTIVLFGWLPFVVVLFAAMTPRRAVIAAFVIAWLFLPAIGYSIPGWPDYTKLTATSGGVLVGMAMFDAKRYLSLRPSWIDLPMLVWCVCPLASSLSNGLGVYDGFSAVGSLVHLWGLPYLVGRLYFQTADDVRELAIGIFLGGLIYVPLCLFEIRMSPQLEAMVYGLGGRLQNAYRGGGWRPRVFMSDGLMLGMWMCMSAAIGVMLLQAGALPRFIARIPVGWAAAVLAITALLCKSAGAIVLMAAGLFAFAGVRYFGTRLVIVVLIAAGPAYCVARGIAGWEGQVLVDASRILLGDKRADSLAFRIANETILAEKAMQRPLFGWGGWGRARVYDEYGHDLSVTDGVWVIAFGNHGLVGLISLQLAMLLPSALFLCGRTFGREAKGASGASAAVAIVVVLYWLDCIPNAMAIPVFTLSAGAVASIVGVAAGRTVPSPATIMLRARSPLRQASPASVARLANSSPPPSERCSANSQ